MARLLSLIVLISCFFTQSGFATSRDYFIAFQDEFLRQQRQYLAAAGIGDPAPNGYIPFTITNNSGLSDTNIYILIEVNSNSLITFANTGGQMLGTLTTPVPMTYVNQSGSGTYTLSTFNNGSGAYVFYLPITENLISSRIYFSVGGPLDWFINAESSLQIPPLDFADLSLDGYYTLFDKQEFTLNANNSFVMNPTLVDYYGLPLSFYITSNQATQYAGLPPSLSSSTIFTNYATAAAPLPTSPVSGTKPKWLGLSLSYTPPSGSSGHLRVLSGASAMKSVNVPAYGSSLQTNFINYFLASNNYASCNWFTTVWNNGGTALYQSNPIWIDLSLAGSGTGVAMGQIDGSGNFNFNVPSTGCGSGSASGFTMTLASPTSSLPFFSGSLGDYTPTPTVNGAPLAFPYPAAAIVIWELFSAGVMSGIIPLSGTSCSSPFTENYIRSQTLFQPNSLLSCTNPPWYDFYSQTFLGMGTGNYTQYYTFSYSDVWATDGTITITNLPQANAQVFINIGSMAGIPIPNPFNDNTTYSVGFNPLPGDGTTVTFGSNPNFSSNPQVPSGGNTGSPYTGVVGGTMYMGVQYTSGPYAGQIWGTHIIPSVSTPALKPVLPGTVTISQTGGVVTISVGSSPQS